MIDLELGSVKELLALSVRYGLHVNHNLRPSNTRSGLLKNTATVFRPTQVLEQKNRENWLSGLMKIGPHEMEKMRSGKTRKGM